MSFNLREQLSSQILKNETVTVKDLHGSLIRTDNIENYGERSIQRALKMFSQLDLIERESDNTFRNKRIDEKYIEKLEELNKEYKPMNNQVNYE